MRNPFTLLITAAGAGSRFTKEGLLTPKPLIKVQGRTLLEHTLESFNLEANDTVLITTQRVHCLPAQLGDKLQQMFPKTRVQWLELDQLLPGQLATAQASTDHWLQNKDAKINPINPLLIHNCDTGFQWHPHCLPINTDASMPVFKAQGDHWSFGQPDPSNPIKAIAIAEKKRISDLASIGLYGFKSMELFHQLAKKQLKSSETVRGEHYIAPMLEKLIKQGKHVSLPRINGVRLYGTPAELLNTFDISMQDLLADNA